jgi:hypothetical protein
MRKMKPEVERAIKTLDEHLVWLASRRIINQNMLDRLAGSLKALVENIGDSGIDMEAQVNALTEQNIKLRLMLRMCDFSEKGILETLSFSYDFLEECCSNHIRDSEAPPINAPLAYDMLRIKHRIYSYYKESESEID